MKKTLTLILVGAVLGSTVAFAASKIFSDVPDNAWYKDAVNSLSEKGIINGYPDGTFGPNNNVNRAELAVMLDRLIQYMETGSAAPSSNLTSAQQSAQTSCYALNGSPYLAFSELYGEQQIFCSFGGGECTQGELNDNVCFMETNADYKSANEKCAQLDGSPYLAFSELYGEDQVFCSFGNEGECTQNELNDGVCFKE